MTTPQFPVASAEVSNSPTPAILPLPKRKKIKIVKKGRILTPKQQKLFEAVEIFDCEGVLRDFKGTLAVLAMGYLSSEDIREGTPNKLVIQTLPFFYNVLSEIEKAIKD